ncbi:MAG: uL13 family ribosomal protein, partial [Candidatus Omnitrophica bacterium]|nr:uL13 family ribosomal protein [Candidatus Omnitrophota bacterium]
MKTYSTKIKDVERKWHVIDASERILGKLATEAASLLMGKHKPTFS